MLVKNLLRVGVLYQRNLPGNISFDFITYLLLLSAAHVIEDVVITGFPLLIHCTGSCRCFSSQQILLKALSCCNFPLLSSYTGLPPVVDSLSCRCLHWLFPNLTPAEYCSTLTTKENPFFAKPASQVMLHASTVARWPKSQTWCALTLWESCRLMHSKLKTRWWQACLREVTFHGSLAHSPQTLRWNSHVKPSQPQSTRKETSSPPKKH